MRREHFERLRPLCPTCRAAGRGAVALQIGAVAATDGDDVLEGALVCGDEACRREHPIVDGIPIVVADLAAWTSHQLDAVLRRDDLSEFTESLLGDAAGDGPREQERFHVSSFGHGHWGSDWHEQLLEAARGLLDAQPSGVWLDAGCAVGRGTVELARAGADLAVGVDLSFAMLKVAEGVRRNGCARYAVKRVGLVYERREVAVANVPADRISLWCADAAALPFADGAFDGALSLNVLDSIGSPLGHLLELGRTLADGAPALLSTPYDWTANATAPDQWIGGHSQRGPSAGASEPELRRILSGAAGIDTGLRIEAERERIPWRLYANERSRVEYEAHVLRLSRSTR